MTKSLVFGVVVASASLSHAQLFKGMSLRAGWFSGFSFPGINPSKIRLEGLSLGADLPLSDQPYLGSKLTLSGTLTMAGRQRKGADPDADLLRLMLINRNRLKGTGLYAITGYGYAEARPRGGTDFRTRKGIVQQYGIGKVLSKFDTLAEAGGKYGELVKGVAPFIEASYLSGSEPFRGWLFEFGLRF